MTLQDDDDDNEKIRREEQQTKSENKPWDKGALVHDCYLYVFSVPSSGAEILTVN